MSTEENDVVAGADISLPELIANTLQDILKRHNVLSSVTVAFNWKSSFFVDDHPYGVIVTSAGEADKISSQELLLLMGQWLSVQSKLARMLAAATKREQAQLVEAAEALRHVEALHDKARTTTENVTTPFREILRIATTEGFGNAITNFEQWFCSVRHDNEDAEEKEENEEKAPRHPKAGR